MEEKKILFVCKFNQTRSQMARGLFEKLNKNKNLKVDSAGIIKANGSKDLMEDLNYVFKKHNLKRKKSKQLSKELLNKQDIIIVVADDVPVSLFSSQKSQGIKIIKWVTKDGHKHTAKTRKERLEKVYLEIEKRVKKLLSSLN
jgi:protein-tyrosine-phosphatase